MHCSSTGSQGAILFYLVLYIVHYWISLYCICTLVHSYIKSWKLVPNDFAQLDASSLNLVKVKGWLFKNLPEKHPYRYVQCNNHL